MIGQELNRGVLGHAGFSVTKYAKTLSKDLLQYTNWTYRKYESAESLIALSATYLQLLSLRKGHLDLLLCFLTIIFSSAWQAVVCTFMYCTSKYRQIFWRIRQKISEHWFFWSMNALYPILSLLTTYIAKSRNTPT
jgi:hypothetical protein